MSAALLRAFAAVRRPPHTRAPFANASRFCSDNAKPPTARTAVERLHTGVDAMPNGRIPPPMGMPSGASVEMEHAVFTDTPLIFDTHRMITYLTQAGFSQPQSVAITDAMARVSQHANRHHQAQMVTKNEFVSLRSELSILEKADFALLKTDINAIEKRMETSVAEIYTAVERVENRVIKWVIAVAGAIGLAIIRLTTTSAPANTKAVVPPPPSNVNDTDLPRIVRCQGAHVLIT